MLQSLIAITAIVLHLASMLVLIQHLRRASTQAAPAILRHLTLLALISLSAFLQVSLFKDQQLHLNFYNALPLISFVIGAILLASLYKRQPIENILVPFYPLSIASLALAAWMPPSSTKIITDPSLTSHIVLSIISYSLITIAAMQALMLAMHEQALKNHKLRGLTRFLPPLQTMERLLFQVLLTGFILLTVAILSGIVFLEDMFAQHLAHKTILTIIAWAIFAVLLYGRFANGWRGIIATHWTLIGFTILMLAYFGSKFVLEIILQRV